MNAPRILHVLPHRGGGGEVYVDLLENLEGYAHDRLHLSGQVRPAAAIPSLAAGLARAARRVRQADVVHVHGDTSTLLMLPILGRRRWLWTTHGLHLLRRSTGPRRAVVARGLRRAVARSSATVCSSSAECEDVAGLVQGGAVAARLERVIVGIPPAAPGDARRVRAELGVGEAVTVCLFAGSLEPRKEPLLAALAAIEASRRGASLCLLMAGDGPLRRDVDALAGDVVRPLGYRRDLDRLMAAADVFVMPSTREGLPLALLEAMSHSVVPVIAEEPGSMEAVGDAGVAVPAGDVAALAGALAGLAEDAAERARLSESAKRRYEQGFRLDRFLAEMDAVYRRVRA